MLIVDIDSDDHLVVQQEAIGRLVGLVEEGASTAIIQGMAGPGAISTQR